MLRALWIVMQGACHATRRNIASALAPSHGAHQLGRLRAERPRAELPWPPERSSTYRCARPSQPSGVRCDRDRGAPPPGARGHGLVCGRAGPRPPLRRKSWCEPHLGNGGRQAPDLRASGRRGRSIDARFCSGGLRRVPTIGLLRPHSWALRHEVRWVSADATTNGSRTPHAATPAGGARGLTRRGVALRATRRRGPGSSWQAPHDLIRICPIVKYRPVRGVLRPPRLLLEAAMATTPLRPSSAHARRPRSFDKPA